jgi:hypothetical protein
LDRSWAPRYAEPRHCHQCRVRAKRGRGQRWVGRFWWRKRYEQQLERRSHRRHVGRKRGQRVEHFGRNARSYELYAGGHAEFWRDACFWRVTCSWRVNAYVESVANSGRNAASDVCAIGSNASCRYPARLTIRRAVVRCAQSVDTGSPAVNERHTVEPTGHDRCHHSIACAEQQLFGANRGRAAGYLFSTEHDFTERDAVDVLANSPTCDFNNTRYDLNNTRRPWHDDTGHSSFAEQSDGAKRSVVVHRNDAWCDDSAAAAVAVLALYDPGCAGHHRSDRTSVLT